jgi:4-hydroxy-tetrahydrodipicolinate reductase
MDEKTKVVQVGMGPLGQMISPHLSERGHIEICAAADINPEMEGVTLAKLCGITSGVSITCDLAAALSKQPDVAVITTVSAIEAILPLIEEVVSRGIHVVSTCEELSYPWIAHPEAASHIDQLARDNNVTVLGTGVNPGFLMDFLPVATTAVCREVKHILVERIQDASFRRLPFRQKIGAGLKESEFRDLTAQGKIRHVGLTESMHMIASKLGWHLDHTEDTVQPVIATERVSGAGWAIEEGYATGVNQIGKGIAGDKEVLRLVFRACVGESDPRDRVKIEGTPEVDLTIGGGVNGDVATCAIVTNAVSAVRGALPGLRTMADISPLSCIN